MLLSDYLLFCVNFYAGSVLCFFRSVWLQVSFAYFFCFFFSGLSGFQGSLDPWIHSGGWINILDSPAWIPGKSLRTGFQEFVESSDRKRRAARSRGFCFFFRGGEVSSPKFLDSRIRGEIAWRSPRVLRILRNGSWERRGTYSTLSSPRGF